MMENATYAAMMVYLAIMTMLVFTAGAVMATSDENTRTMGSSSSNRL